MVWNRKGFEPFEDMVWAATSLNRKIKTRIEIFGLPAGTVGHVIKHAVIDERDKVQILFPHPNGNIVEWLDRGEYGRWIEDV